MQWLLQTSLDPHPHLLQVFAKMSPPQKTFLTPFYHPPGTNNPQIITHTVSCSYFLPSFLHYHSPSRLSPSLLPPVFSASNSIPYSGSTFRWLLLGASAGIAAAKSSGPPCQPMHWPVLSSAYLSSSRAGHTSDQGNTSRKHILLLASGTPHPLGVTLASLLLLSLL